MSNTKHAVDGVKWNYASKFVLAFAQLAFTAIFARLLEPAVFGILAMSNVMIKFGGYFAGAGVVSYLIQKDNLEKDEIQAAFVLTSIIGLSLSIIVYSLAPVGGIIFGTTAVEPVIQALSIVYIFSSVAITSNALLYRAMSFKKISLVELGAYVFSYLLVGLPLAFSGHGVWALIYAILVQHCLVMLATYYCTKHPIGFDFAWTRLWQIFVPGSHYSLNSILEFIVSSLPTLIIGRSLGEAQLGIFNRANMLVNLPVANIVVAVGRVFFPFISRLQNQRGRMKTTYMKAATLTSAVYIPFCMGVIPAAQEVVLVVLGKNWERSIPLVQILAVAMVFEFSAVFQGQCGDALRKLREKTVVQLLTILVISGMILGFLGWGLEGAAVGIVVGQAIRFALYIYLVKRWLGLKVAENLTIFLPSLAIGGVVMAVVWLVHTLGQTLPVFVLFVLEASAGFVTYVLVVRWMPSALLKNSLYSIVDVLDGAERSIFITRALKIVAPR